MGPRVVVPGTLGAKIEKYAVVKYIPAVTDPSAACSSRPEALLFRPAAPFDVMMVASNGAAVINPSRW
jgi:hypothetical protein